MGIRFNCEHCDKRVHVKDFLAGRRARCPHCSEKMTIPAVSTVSKEEAAEGSGTEQEKPTAVQHGTVVELGQLTNKAEVETPKKQSSDASVEKPRIPKNRHLDANGKHKVEPREQQEKKDKSQPTNKSELHRKPVADQPGPAKRDVKQEVKPAKKPAIAPEAPSPDELSTKKPSKTQSPANAKVTADSPSTEKSKGKSKIDVQASRETGPVASSETFQDVRNDSPKPDEPVGIAEPTMSASLPVTKPDPFAEAPEAMWYVAPPSGGKYGPADAKMMQSWVAEGRVSADSLVWREGWEDWRSAKIVMPESGTPMPLTPPAVPAGPVTADSESGDKPASGKENDASQSDAVQGVQTEAADSKRASTAEANSSETVPSSMRYHRARNKSRTMGIALIFGLAIISIGLLVWLVIAVTSGP